MVHPSSPVRTAISEAAYQNLSHAARLGYKFRVPLASRTPSWPVGSIVETPSVYFTTRTLALDYCVFHALPEDSVEASAECRTITWEKVSSLGGVRGVGAMAIDEDDE